MAQRGFLIAQTGGRTARRIPIGEHLLVGRAADCGLVIDDAGASRHHVEIRATENGFLWQDLGSTNGTLHNGAREPSGLLSQGDRLQIGETVLRFEVEEDASDPLGREDTTIFKQTLVDWASTTQAESGQTLDSGLLRALYAIVNEIAATYDPCTLVDRILEKTTNAINAQRAAVLFASRLGDSLLACPECGRFHVIHEGKIHHVEEDQVHISNTVAYRVLSKGESLLYQDTRAAVELSDADSVLGLSLRSIMCVPLRGKMGMVGILYVDTNRPGQEYTYKDMLLTTAVGNSAGLALENATLHRQILEKQRMEQEIQHAWAIQEGFLVKQWPQDDRRFAAYGETRPAKTVGGDFYDFVRLEAHRVGILVGDVSGKGVPAALTMAQLLAQFRLYARRLGSPAEVLKAINEDLHARSRRGLFCTFCYATLDLAAGRLQCANAGHHAPLRVGPESVELFCGASGPPAGVLPTAQWENVEAVLEPGDLVLLYTDGIVEARGAATRGPSDNPRREFGIERLYEVVFAARNAPPEKIIQAVNRAVLAHCAPNLPHDDCTMVAMRYLG